MFNLRLNLHLQALFHRRLTISRFSWPGGGLSVNHTATTRSNIPDALKISRHILYELGQSERRSVRHAWKLTSVSNQVAFRIGEIDSCIR